MATAKKKAKAPAAGGGSPGTNTSEGIEPATAVEASGVSLEAGAGEAASEDLARKVEAVLKPGESIDDIGKGRSAEPAVVTHIEVRSTRPRGRRRAGRSWGPQAVRVAVSELTADEIEALYRDPLLQVEFVGAGE